MSKGSTVSQMKLSIIIPCYNEEHTLKKAVSRIFPVDIGKVTKEIIIIDDGSTDRSVDMIHELEDEHPEIIGLVHEVNQGKGAALKTGLNAASGDIVLIQDADMEYSPVDYPRLLEPILDDRADVVYGSRFKGGEPGRVLFFWHSAGNKFLTLTSNMMTDLNLTDMETGYKVFKREVIEKIEIEEKRFGVEPEMTAKIAKLDPRPRIYEVGISYAGRTYAEGKKIGWKDGFRALYCIMKYK